MKKIFAILALSLLPSKAIAATTAPSPIIQKGDCFMLKVDFFLQKVCGKRVKVKVTERDRLIALDTFIYKAILVPNGTYNSDCPEEHRFKFDNEIKVDIFSEASIINPTPCK